MLFSLSSCAPHPSSEGYPWPIGEKNSARFSEEPVTITLVENSLWTGGAEFLVTNTSNKNFEYGAEYSVQIEIDGKWYEIEWYNSPENKNKDVVWDAGGYGVAANSKEHITENWAFMYGELPPGQYRYVKKLSRLVVEFYVCCPFTIA